MNIELLNSTNNEPMQTEIVGRLARLLLNPSLDRRQIASGILDDKQLMNFLRGYYSIVLESITPPGMNWMETRHGEHDVNFTGRVLNRPREKFVMPMLMGTLTGNDGLPWFQSSAHEFISSFDDVKTTNIGGKPAFKANLNPAWHARRARHLEASA